MKWEVRTMRSGTSYFDRTVFQKTFTRFWPLWAGYSAIWVILLPLSGLATLQLELRETGYMESFACRTVPQMCSAALGMSIFFGVLAAMAVFSHLYNPRSANFFGSLPVRREGLFLTHYLAGLAFLILPNLVIALLTLLVELAGGYVSVQGLLFWLVAACGEGFFFYSLAVFCGMFTGHILALPAFYAVVNILAYGLMALFYTTLQSFYYGFCSLSDWVSEAVRWLTPAWNLGGQVSSSYGHSMEGAERALITRGMWVVGIYALAAVALAAAAFFLYRARRLESAGDVVSVRAMRPVFKYGVALCVGLAFGYGTAFFLGRGEVTLMAAILVWGVAGYFAAQMLLDKSFRVFKKWKGAAAVAGVFAALFLVVGLDLTGFETRVPGPGEVQVVHLQRLSVETLGDDGDQVAETITDPKFIQMVTAIHQAAVNQGEGNVWPQGYGVGRNVGLRVDYELKNGSTMSRQYSMIWLDPQQVNQEGTAAWAVEQFYQDRELQWSVYGFDTLEQRLATPGWRLSEVRYENYEDGSHAPNHYYHNQDAQDLLAAVKEDFFAGRIGVRSVTHPYDGGGRTGGRSIIFQAENDDNYVWSVNICVQDTASSTLAVLERLEET